MFWIMRAARRLRELGILGMNSRNAEYILDHNPRALFPVVDDKLKMHELCKRIGVPAPEVFAALASFGKLRDLGALLKGRAEFVVKPNRGSGGRGILVVTGRDGDHLLRHNGTKMTLDDLRQHLSDILSGMYSLGGLTDVALLQQRVHLHAAFEPYSFKGIPDVRVILYKNKPALAMLRLPTRASGGRANLHQGGLGAGIHLATGTTHHAVLRGKSVTVHPDTGASLIGIRIPFWQRVLEISQSVAAAVGMGYLGVDIVIDADHGPMLLEANARPGLAIQMANGMGLYHKLREIDASQERPARKAPVLTHAVPDGSVWRHDAPEGKAFAPHAPPDMVSRLIREVISSIIV
jgi:alpha-L-glutamate ligase-like protein